MHDKFRIGRYWIDKVTGSESFYRFHYEPGAREVSRRSLKTGDYEEAKIRLAAFVLEEGQASPSDPGSVAIITVLNRYFVEHSDRRPNPCGARRAGALFLDFMGSAAKVNEITRAKQREFIEHLHSQDFSVGYIARILATISAAINRAADDDGMLLQAPKIVISPAKIAEQLNVAEPVPDNWHPTLEQIARFMDVARSTEALRYALLTLVFAGRPLAVRGASPEQFDKLNGLFAFNPEGRRQTKKYRPTLPVPPRLLPHLATWENLVGKDVRKPWARTLKDARLPKQFTPKSLRHFMATEMRKRGVPKEQREEWMGHRRHSTNDRYGHFSPDYLLAARDCADAVLAELEALCKLSIYRQVAAKSEGRQVGKDLYRFDPIEEFGAGERARTADPNLGKVKRSA